MEQGEDEEPPTKVSIKLLGQIKRSITLSPEEMKVNQFLMPLLLASFWLIRVPSVATWTTNSLRYFPFHQMLDYEPLSIVDWVIHYSMIVYNIGIIQSLFKTDGKSDSKRKRAFAIAVGGLGQLFGTTTLILHSLISIGSPAEQALHNFSHFMLLFSTMSVGALMTLSTVLGIPFLILVWRSLMKGILSFQNIPGLVLVNSGLLAVILSPKRDFSSKFKAGYFMICLAPVVEKIANNYFGAGTDIGHMLVAFWLLVCTLFQRWSLLGRNHF